MILENLKNFEWLNEPENVIFANKEMMNELFEYVKISDFSYGSVNIVYKNVKFDVTTLASIAYNTLKE